MPESQEFNPEAIAIQVEFAKLSPEHLVLNDKLVEIGIKTDALEYAKFLNSFDSAKADTLLQLIDSKVWSEPKTS